MASHDIFAFLTTKYKQIAKLETSLFADLRGGGPLPSEYATGWYDLQSPIHSTSLEMSEDSSETAILLISVRR